jgi:hypothetical protein
LVPLVTLAGGALARVDLRLPLVLGGVLATLLAAVTARAVAGAATASVAAPRPVPTESREPELVAAEG